MRRFRATLFTANEIQLENEKEIDELYELIKKEEDFIIQTPQGSQVVIATPLIARFRNGEIKLSGKTGDVKP